MTRIAANDPVIHVRVATGDHRQPRYNRGMSLELLFLGSGTSAGIPMIGCDCRVCRSDDPRDQRTRPSVLIRYPGNEPGTSHQFLIDTAPEMRIQVIRHAITRIDGVLITHPHADHIFGLDDLRRFNVVMQGPIDLHAEEATLQRLQSIFGYIFEPHTNLNQSFVANLVPHPIKVGTAMTLCAARWTPLRLMHGRLPILGFRVDRGRESLAYCTDASGIPPETYPLLEDLDVLIIDALRYRHHPTHFTVDQALQQIEQLRPKRAYLTHMAHDILHADLESRLPKNVFLSYDGLVVNCSGDTERQPGLLQ